jgi:hypothetical protein
MFCSDAVGEADKKGNYSATGWRIPDDGTHGEGVGRTFKFRHCR